MVDSSSCIIFLPVHGVLPERILVWFVIPFSSGPHFVRTLHHDPLSGMALHGMSHRFIDLHRVLIHVIIYFLPFCDCGFHCGGCVILLTHTSVLCSFLSHPTCMLSLQVSKCPVFYKSQAYFCLCIYNLILCG